MQQLEHELSLASATGTQSLRDYDTVRRAIRFLSERWQDQPDLDQLAVHLGLSAAHTQKLFKRWCGLSPKEFIQALTLDHARAMLSNSAAVLDAAHDSGLSGSGRLHDLFVTYEAMTPGEAKNLGSGLEMAYGFHVTPFGEALAVMTPRGLAGLAFVDEDKGQSRADILTEMRTRWPLADWVERAHVSGGVIRQIFGGDGGAARPIRLVLIGTDWEIRVWDALLKIPAGRAVSYADIARNVCSVKASRAVGNAVGKNPVSFVVPCHRVLRADGSLGGYHWGVTRKRAIIGWEAGRVLRGVAAE